MSLSPCLERKAPTNASGPKWKSSLGALAELRNSDQADRSTRLAAYLEQIETWGTVYALVEAGKLEATGVLAVKKR